MGMRFRKSVKICKGVKVNISKSGASLSLGGRGHSVNVSSRGVKGTVGLPGTGVSYSTMLSSGSNKTKQAAVTNAPTGSFTVQMNDKGHIAIFNRDGSQITDQAILRKIKSTAQFQALKAQLELSRQQKMTELVDNSRCENEKFINIHKLSAQVLPAVEAIKRIAEMEPQQYEREAFATCIPDMEAISKQVQKEAEAISTGNIFTLGKRRRQYVEEQVPLRYQSAMQQWEKEKQKFENEQDVIQTQQNEVFRRMHEETIGYLQQLYAGQSDLICNEIDSWISDCTLPVEINVNYDWQSETGTVLLDVNLPGIETLPTTEIIRLESGNIKERKKTQAEIREQYTMVTFGLAVFITSHIFSISPAIKRVLISGFALRRDKNGEAHDDYIYSIRFHRKTFEHGKQKYSNPRDFCMSAENRCNQTSTGLFKAIVPFDGFE